MKWQSYAEGTEHILYDNFGIPLVYIGQYNEENENWYISFESNLSFIFGTQRLLSEGFSSVEDCKIYAEGIIRDWLKGFLYS